MFTLILVDREYETSVSIWNLKWWSYRNDIFIFISSRYKIINHKTQMQLSLLMNIGTLIWLWIFEYQIGIIEVSTSSKYCFLTLFQFLTRLLSSKHLKLYNTYLVGRNGTMWKTCFSGPKNAKKENQLKHKTKCVTDFLLTVMSSSMKDYTCHYVEIT